MKESSKKNEKSNGFSYEILLAITGSIAVTVIQKTYLKLPWLWIVIAVLTGIMGLLFFGLIAAKKISLKWESKSKGFLNERLGKLTNNRKFINFTILFLSILALSLLFPLLESSEEHKINAYTIYDNLQDSLSTEAFKIKKENFTKMIEGFDGEYYSLDLIDLTNEEPSTVLYFDLEKYTIDDIDKRFGTALEYLKTNIFDFLDKGSVEYDIFIEGGADRGNFERKLNADFANIKIDYYPLLPGRSNMFSKKTQSLKLDSTFSNSDLPLLRAEFLRRVLNDWPYKLKKPKILQGDIVVKPDPEKRYVKIYIYVKWPNYFEYIGR